ncbi:MAG: hypothetical protein Q8Q08_11630 [Candidatus Omnitrophota bacterium]|nr:hypothetical protein [Candidatus Omnitrophota bacterium]MDZ4241199.1 hypothetical protein [Candidatus Omnitrophota bacterium]
MSRILNQLAQTQDLSHVNKFTQAVQKGAEAQAAAPTHPRDTIVLRGATFYTLLGSVIIVGFLAVVVSLRTTGQVERDRKLSKQLIALANNQGKRIKALESDVAAMKDFQDRKLTALEKSFQTMVQQADGNEQALSKLLEDQAKIKVSVDSLKISDRTIMNKYFDLNDEVRKLKAQNMSEVISLP